MKLKHWTKEPYGGGYTMGLVNGRLDIRIIPFIKPEKTRYVLWGVDGTINGEQVKKCFFDTPEDAERIVILYLRELEEHIRFAREEREEHKDET